MYRIDGSSDLKEDALDHWRGYRGSAPVRIGNGAAEQLQLDIYGEALDSIYAADRAGLGAAGQRAGRRSRGVLDWLADNWDQPEEGIWETRGGRQPFTYGRVMCWVAFDRGIRMATERGPAGAAGALDRRAGPDLRAGHGRGLPREPAGVRPALRHRRPRLLAAADADGRVHRRHRPAVAVDAARRWTRNW